MSSEDDYNDADNNSGAHQGSKKRRIQRACDICRRKKIRCDGAQMPGNRCSNCIAYTFDCTYVEAAKKRGPPKGYVESLETRLEKMEKLLYKLCPSGDFAQELDVSVDREAWAHDLFGGNLPDGSRGQPSATSGPSSHLATSYIRGQPVVPQENLEDLLPSDDDENHLMLADKLRKMTLDLNHHRRFFGKSSGVMLIQKAIDLKKEYAGDDDDEGPLLPSKRPEFWNVRTWEKNAAPEEYPEYRFPDDDLMSSLVDLYFSRVNIYAPLLHRPTFLKSISDGLHLRDALFGSIVLLVCAVASRYSEDQRVFLDGTDSTHSCGWKYFTQVQMVRKSLLAPPALGDLQFYALTVTFLQGSSAPQATWTMVGIGIRLAQDVGAHRRKVYGRKPTVEDELWKRAFWVLVCIDRNISSTLGRPCAIQDEDFDLDLPMECDDEYWENPDPELNFKQPLNKPSIIAYFNCYLKLNQILAFALRTIYSINKSKILLGFVGPQWEQHIVAELDSALNKWIDSVPDHLRWDPNREDEVFFAQSASLYVSYYHLQILIHRPFIPSPRRPSPLSFPSLAICTNAARSCSHIIDVQSSRSKLLMPNAQMAVFTAGIVLLLNIWGGKRSGLSTDPNKEMAEVHKCMRCLRMNEGRWHSAGRLWDILYELASVGDLPLPQPSPPGNKRERDSDDPINTSNLSSPSVFDSNRSTPAVVTDIPRVFAGPRRVSREISVTAHLQQRQNSHQAVPENYPLPVYSDELGRLPVHGQFSFSNPIADQSSNAWFSDMHNASRNLHQAGPAPGGTHVNGYSNMSAGYQMDPMFFDQLPTNFATPFAGAHSIHGQGQGQGVPYHPHPGMGGIGAAAPTLPSHNAEGLMDNDTITMWSTAPTGFELDDWGTYITNVSEMTHSSQNGGVQ